MATPTSTQPFAALLKRLRLAAGLTQEGLAERAGLSARAVSDLERGGGRSPRLETVTLLAEALRLDRDQRAALLAAARPAAEPAPDPAPPSSEPRSNLPFQLTSFVGRERELADVIEALGGARLVTLTGPGGVGKSRLAFEAAALAPGYPDGVWLAEFASLADPALVPRTVAAALGVREPPDGDSRRALLGALRARRLLLVLDNCEHLLDACASLAEAVLRACAGVRVLATSREALAVAGEVRWPVPPLPTPPTDRPLSADQLARYPAATLFLERARAVLPGFTPTPHEAALVDLCAQLDGMPLALELAAAQAAWLTLPQLAGRLHAHFRLLTGGSRTSLPRQRTLRATIDWSHDLLGDDERRLFRRLAVFAGGWTVEAAEAVAAGDGLAQEDVLDLLLRLAAKSLVVAVGGRYRLLETVRQYAVDRLAERGEEDAVRARHAAYYLALAEARAPRLKMGGPAADAEGLEQERDNLRAALHWYAARDDAPALLRLAGELEWFWFFQDYASEGRRWLDQALARQGEADAQVRAHALHAVGVLAWARGAYPEAEALLQESVARFRQLGDRRAVGWSLLELAASRRDHGRYEAASAAIEDGLELAAATGDRAL